MMSPLSGRKSVGGGGGGGGYMSATEGSEQLSYGSRGDDSMDDVPLDSMSLRHYGDRTLRKGPFIYRE